ncbi:MAG: TMEM165/GDT1 family protein [bacterium]|nr:MAG: TMEM165/GDT1 family protein [bacterium]
MEALFSSTAAVTIAEIGDKTQLLSLFLSSRFRERYLIVAGIFVATIFNHTASAWLGVWMIDLIPSSWAPWIISGSFIVVALWLLIPDKADRNAGGLERYGAFAATTVLFFLAEIGDKTQVATVVLAAKYSETLWVILGTTLGMLAANIPVIFAGRWIMDRTPFHFARWIAFALFIGLAVITLAGTF